VAAILDFLSKQKPKHGTPSNDHSYNLGYNQEYPDKKNTDLPKVTDKVYHITAKKSHL